jgi:alkylation response protein AidB-like acyl-CoA dehydrogenase
LKVPNMASYPLRNHLLATADDLSERLRAAHAECEELRHLPQGLAQALADAGLYRMFTPTHLGGHEVDAGTFVRVIERLARANPSAAWCTFISCTSAIVAGYLSDEVAQEIFKLPDVKLAGVFAPRGRATAAERDGVAGYIVNGSWPWGSGSRNADYISGGCLVIDKHGKAETTPSGTPNVHLLIFNADQVSLIDNWHVLGMRGSGSNEFDVRDVFVPASRAVSLLTDTPRDGALYKFPVFCLLAVGIAAVALGVARQAIDSLIELANEKTPQGSAKLLAERTSTQEHVARSEARLRAATAFLHKTVDAAWQASLAPGPISTEHKRDIRLSTTFATEEAAAIVDRMHRTAGGSSVFESSALEHCLRDVHVATQHMMVNESTYEVVGRLFLGLPTNVTML